MNKYKSTIDENFFVDKVLKWIIDIVVVIMTAMFILNISADRTQVIGNSMSPTLNNNEYILINKFTYSFVKPSRFDVIVFNIKDDENYYIKRVIGLPGETIQIKDGSIYVNDKKLEYNINAEAIVTSGLAMNKIILEKDEFFVMGDNWNNSEDSRFARIGNISKSNIIGKAWLEVSSIKSINLID